MGIVDIKEKDDFRLDRVKKLLAPVGNDQTAIPIYRFDYHATVKKNKEGNKKVAQGYTDVFDAKNHKLRYKYDEHHRLVAIIRYSGSDSASYTPYSKESFIWDDRGYVTTKIFEDGDGNIYHAKVFTYDSYGNVLTSTFCGKLTGQLAPPLLLGSKGKLIENGYEREIKTYSYSNDGLNLLLSETDAAGKTIKYIYIPDTDHLSAKLISYSGEIRLREFYFYDENFSLEKKIIDDGCRESHEDLSYVTERRFILLSPRKEAPIGLPKRLEEWAFDMYTHTLVPLKQAHYSYSPYGKIQEETCFDNDGKEVYRRNWDFDLHGNLIQETDPLEIAIHKKYDLGTDNLIAEEFPDISIVNTYDFANRLIEKKEIHSDEVFSTHFQYDILGNCKLAIDSFERQTRQVFDEFGRVTEVHQPALIKDGNFVIPITKTVYDIAGFPLIITNVNQEITRTEVNIRGQPTMIHYPDGTKEEMLYSVDGQLIQKKEKNGTLISYSRDPLGRVTEETVRGGEEVKCTVHCYNALHLLESIGPEGNLTTYSYDSAGRLKEVIKSGKKTEQHYDALGRVSEIREYESSHAYRSTVKEYDLLDRVVAEFLQTSDGIILHESHFDYDVRGNQILAQSGSQKTQTQYNTRNQPVLMIDGLGNRTHISYNLHFINAFGQQVLQKITCDPLGYKTIETYDTGNRLVEAIRLNLLGEKIGRQVFSYDLLGNQIKTEQEVIEKKKIVRTIMNLFAYNPIGQLVKITEAAFSPEQKITSIHYNTSGQKTILIKSSGIKLHYSYDGFGRLKKCASSDGTVDYQYAYNLLDQATCITDALTGKATFRSYQDGEISSEILANGLAIHYTYDKTGRARLVTFPDKTGIEYVYNPVDLKEIHRLVDGKRTYCHQDLEHSLSGQVIKACLPGNCGKIAYRFDSLDRCISIKSNVLKQKISPGGFDPVGNLLSYTLQNISYTFTYDDHFHLEQENGHEVHRHTFDSLSNHTSKDGELYQQNPLNQLIKKGGEVLDYNNDGCLTS